MSEKKTAAAKVGTVRFLPNREEVEPVFDNTVGRRRGSEVRAFKKGVGVQVAAAAHGGGGDVVRRTNSCSDSLSCRWRGWDCTSVSSSYSPVIAAPLNWLMWALYA